MKNALPTTYVISTLVALLVLGTTAWAQDDAADNANDPNALLVKVVAVKGIVKTKQGNVEDSAWTKLNVNDRLDEYAIIHTGFGSSAELDFSDRGKILVGSGTKIGISQYTSLNSEQGTVKARLGVKYGSLRLAVDRSRGKNDFSVATPVATAAVRGTDGLMSYWSDSGFNLSGSSGTFSLFAGQRMHYVGANQQSNDKLDRSDELKGIQRDPKAAVTTDAGSNETEKKFVRDTGGSSSTALNNSTTTTPTLTESYDYHSDNHYEW